MFGSLGLVCRQIEAVRIADFLFLRHQAHAEQLITILMYQLFTNTEFSFSVTNKP